MWMLTNTGRYIDLADMKRQDIDLRDIAHGLTKRARYGGQPRHMYSVAEHSLYMAGVVEAGLYKPHFSEPLRKELVQACLLHDAAEAYIGDVIGPLKRFASEEWLEVERSLESLIWARFGVKADAVHAVKGLDYLTMITETQALWPKHRLELSHWGFTAEDFAAARLYPEVKLMSHVPDYLHAVYRAYLGKCIEVFKLHNTEVDREFRKGARG